MRIIYVCTFNQTRWAESSGSLPAEGQSLRLISSHAKDEARTGHDIGLILIPRKVIVPSLSFAHLVVQ